MFNGLTALPVTAPTVEPAPASSFAAFLFSQRPTIIGSPASAPLHCTPLSISTTGAGVVASNLALLPDGTLPQQGQGPSPSCGSPTTSDYDLSGDTYLYWTINWQTASSCGWNYGYPVATIYPRTVIGTLGINANRDSPEMGNTCTAQPASTTTQCRYAWLKSSCTAYHGLVEYCWWTVTINFYGGFYSEAQCTFPDDPDVVLDC